MHVCLIMIISLKVPSFLASYTHLDSNACQEVLELCFAQKMASSRLSSTGFLNISQDRRPTLCFWHFSSLQALQLLLFWKTVYYSVVCSMFISPVGTRFIHFAFSKNCFSENQNPIQIKNSFTCCGWNYSTSLIIKTCGAAHGICYLLLLLSSDHIVSQSKILSCLLFFFWKAIKILIMNHFTFRSCSTWYLLLFNSNIEL